MVTPNKAQSVKPTEHDVHTLLKVIKQESEMEWLIFRLVTEHGFSIGEVVGNRYGSELLGIQIEDISDDKIYLRRAHSKEQGEWVPVGAELIRKLRDFAGERTKGRLFENVWRRGPSKRDMSVADPSNLLRPRLKRWARQAKIAGWRELKTEDLRNTLTPLQVKLADFDPYIALQAQSMIPYFVLNFSLERTVRKMVAETLKSKYSEGWWDSKVPEDVRLNVARRQADDHDSPRVIRSIDKLDYTTFPELRVIIEANWADFEDQFSHGRIEDMSVIPRDLGYGRVLIAHSCNMPDEEKKRFDLRVGDWFRIISQEANR